MTKRTFLVTGPSKGIGRALSQRRADSGYHVVGAARGKDPGFPGMLVPIDLGDSRTSGEAFADLAPTQCLRWRREQSRLAPSASGRRDRASGGGRLLRMNVYPTIQTVQAILPTLKARGWGQDRAGVETSLAREEGIALSIIYLDHDPPKAGQSAP